MKSTRTLRQQEAAAAKATTPRQPKPLTAEALAARERYLATMARIKAAGGMPTSNSTEGKE